MDFKCIVTLHNIALCTSVRRYFFLFTSKLRLADCSSFMQFPSGSSNLTLRRTVENLFDRIEPTAWDSNCKYYRSVRISGSRQTIMIFNNLAVCSWQLVCTDKYRSANLYRIRIVWSRVESNSGSFNISVLSVLIKSVQLDFDWSGIWYESLHSVIPVYWFCKANSEG